MDVKGHLQLEPLSRRLLRCDSIEFPGHLQWMPPALESLEKEPENVDISMLPEARTSPLSTPVACSCSFLPVLAGHRTAEHPGNRGPHRGVRVRPHLDLHPRRREKPDGAVCDVLGRSFPADFRALLSLSVPFF